LQKKVALSITSSAMLTNDDGTLSPNSRSASCPPLLEERRESYSPADFFQ